jgi:diguanylate cyclase (GGDEF)-like protein/PAS domain S-box-containing protein
VKLPLRRADGSIYALCGISTDVTERKRFEEVQRLNAQVFESSEEGIVITDAANNIVSVNRAWCEITGYAAEEVLGRNPRLLASGQQGKPFYQHMWQEIAGQGHWQGELINRRKNGVFYPQWLSITVIRDEAGRIINHIGIISDLSEHKAREERIEFLSNYDPLTLLPNRALLRDRAELALAGARRSKDRVSLLYIDLDRFKIVNESLGPSIGDQLLKEFSGRLRSQLHADQTLCRQGGDDFILLLPDTDAEAAAHVASTVLESCAQPLFIGKQRLVLTACIGIAVFPEDGQDYEQLTRAADAALFRAKKSGPGSFQFFTPQMHEHASEVLQLEGELRQAIEHKQLLLHYQPQFDLASGQLVGAEALVRWQHPDKGLVPPSRFIPLAEESGLIVDIGSWVLHEAIRQNRFWQIEGLAVVPIAINLSALQFRQSSFYAQVVSALSESGLPPGLLELELTEGIAMEDTEYTVNILAKLHSHGLALAIDDFGIGYSSLSYLKRYTVDTLKIDQSFVQGLGSNSGDEEIINAIIGMARSLGFKTLAEGVETPEQLQYLRERQCDQVQGFLFARPLSAEDFALLLRRGGRMTLEEPGTA